MTFRAGKSPSSSVLTTTFDYTLRIATEMSALNIKPQVFLYHPGHLDILDYLIEHDALAKPYYVERGVKGIFCEKPLAPTLREADALIKACDDHGVRLAINHTRRGDPYVRLNPIDYDRLAGVDHLDVISVPGVGITAISVLNTNPAHG